MIKKIKKIFIILIINSCFINSLYATEANVLRIGSEKAKITVKTGKLSVGRKKQSYSLPQGQIAAMAKP